MAFLVQCSWTCKESRKPRPQNLFCSSQFRRQRKGLFRTNLIHNKTRNWLQPNRADKLAFIYTNACILNQHDVPSTTSATADFASKPIDKLTQEEEVRLEDILVELQVEDEDDTMDQEELNEGYEEEEGNAWEATEDIDY